MAVQHLGFWVGFKSKVEADEILLVGQALTMGETA